MRVTNIYFTVFLTFWIQEAGAISCDQGWFQSSSGETCYYVYDSRSIGNAVLDLSYVCEDLGGHLAKLFSTADIGLIGSKIPRLARICIGLTDIQSEGVFQWLDESYMDEAADFSSFWEGLNPQTTMFLTEADCVVIVTPLIFGSAGLRSQPCFDTSILIPPVQYAACMKDPGNSTDVSNKIIVNANPYVIVSRYSASSGISDLSTGTEQSINEKSDFDTISAVETARSSQARETRYESGSNSIYASTGVSSYSLYTTNSSGIQAPTTWYSSETIDTTPLTLKANDSTWAETTTMEELSVSEISTVGTFVSDTSRFLDLTDSTSTKKETTQIEVKDQSMFGVLNTSASDILSPQALSTSELTINNEQHSTMSVMSSITREVASSHFFTSPNAQTIPTTYFGEFSSTPNATERTSTTAFINKTVCTKQLTPIISRCRCQRRDVVVTNQSLKELKRELKIHLNDTSAFKAKFHSAVDDRTSSKVIGSTGIIVVSVIFGVIACQDLKWMLKR